MTSKEVLEIVNELKLKFKDDCGTLRRLEIIMEYCDHLESVIKQKNDFIASSYIELNKALDRACGQLQHMILGTKPLIQYTPEQWKEILLNDKSWEDTEKYE